MKLNDMYPRKYATGADLNGKPATLMIKAVRSERMRPNPKSEEVEKWVIFFHGAGKGVVMGRLLAGQIAQVVGSDDTDDWTGKQVTLYPEPVTVAGTPRIAIRARKVNINGG